jgi:hypothetical protein
VYRDCIASGTGSRYLKDVAMWTMSEIEVVAFIARVALMVAVALLAG